MLNWYRVSPIVVPSMDEKAVDAPLLQSPADMFEVRMPHLVVWGEDDAALTPACLEGLSRFANDLHVVRVAGTGHWILHERPERVCGEVLAFLDRPAHSAH